MPIAVHIPRVSTNDDSVRVAGLMVAAGAFVRAGETLLELESDKAVITVEAEQDGFVLAVLAQVGETIGVGKVALWLGKEGEAAPASGDEQGKAAKPAGGQAAPTAKARTLLQRYGLSAEDVQSSGERLTETDVAAHVALHGLAEAGSVADTPSRTPAPALPAAATIHAAVPARRGMIASVCWQRDHAAPAYLELPYDPAPWEAYAAECAKAHRMLFSPLLALMAYRLVTLVRETPMANATVIDRPDGPAEAIYDAVNLGFTVQAGDVLYLVVLEDANHLAEMEFANKLADLQRRAITRKLKASELQGATIGFSSMARWGVSRHIPVLAPHTSVMVAHAVSTYAATRTGILGVTYDHRVLSGADVIRLLRSLASPPAASPA